MRNPTWHRWRLRSIAPTHSSSESAQFAYHNAARHDDGNRLGYDHEQEDEKAGPTHPFGP